MPGPPVPPLESARCVLRPVTPTDQPFLYDLVTTPPVSLRWLYRGATPSPEEFGLRLWANVLAQFVIETPDEQPVGLVVLNNASLRDGHAYLGLFCDEQWWRRGVGIDATVLLLHYAFTVWELRKVYLEVPGWNLEQVASIDRWFEEEGRLRDHVRVGDHSTDLHILAIRRDRVVGPAADLPGFARRALGQAEPPATGGAVGDLPAFAARLATILGLVEPPSAITRIADLVDDSLALVELIESIEHDLGVTLDDDLIRIDTVADAHEAIVARQNR